MLCQKEETKEILLQGSLKDGLYVFDDFFPLSQCSANTSSVQSLPQTFTLWNHRFSRAHANIIHRILKHCNVPHNINHNFCDSCVLGKMHQLPFSDSTIVFSAPFQLVYLDIWGPAPVLASNDSFYYITFLDAYSRYIWIYLLQHKFQTYTIFQTFHKFVEKQIGFQLKCT